MTEQPDTAAMRAYFENRPRLARREAIFALCDALDAAREEIATTDREVFAQIARAEAAEARIAELDVMVGLMREDNNSVHDTAVHHAARAEAAESRLDSTAQQLAIRERELDNAYARITAALAILHDCHVTAEDMNRVRRALIGGDQ